MTRQDHLDGRACAILLACALFWGFQQVLVKATLPELPPVFMAGVRSCGAAVLLWLWCRWRGVRLFERDGSLWAGLLVGLLFAAEFAALYLGLRQSTAARVTTFLYTSPFWIALVLPFFVAAERLRAIQWAGLVCAFAAVAFVLREGFLHPAAGVSWQGDVLGLLGGVFWGLTTVAIRATRIARVTAEKCLFYQLAVSAIALPLLSLALGEPWTAHWSAFALLSVAIQTLGGAFASYLAWMWLLLYYPATRISTFVFLTPIFTLMFDALLLHEPVTPSLVVALALVALGIVLVNRQTPGGSVARATR